MPLKGPGPLPAAEWVGRLLSREQCLTLMPALADASLTGGALWYDARMMRPERLTLAFVLSAVPLGLRRSRETREDVIARGCAVAVADARQDALERVG